MAPFDVLAGCESLNVEPGGGSVWASVRIVPRGAPLERERAPLALCLVVDVSGSMSGTPLEHVVRSCDALFDLLNERDRLSIVTFSTHAAVLSGLTPVDAGGRGRLRASLRTVVAHGNTNLHGGIGVAAAVLGPSPEIAGLRRAMVVMSDGQPNVGLATGPELADFVRSLGVAVSSLGFGVHHDEDVLHAIATAGSGRYAYIPDPIVARVDLARAALAHGGVVADRLQLGLRPAEGVEVREVLPPGKLRVTSNGLAMAVGDVFVDEGREIALELGLAPQAGGEEFPTSLHCAERTGLPSMNTDTSRGRLCELFVEGVAPDGTVHRAEAAIEVDVRRGPRVTNPEVARSILLVRGEAARSQARAQADRGSKPAAVAILKEMVARIDALPGFVANDGSPLAELREQLVDESEHHAKQVNELERSHMRKGAMSHTSARLGLTAMRDRPPVRAVLQGLTGPTAGRQFELFTENRLGRSISNEIPVPSSSLSRVHARIVFVGSSFVLEDSGSTNGTYLNGKLIHSVKLSPGDELQLGEARFSFQVG
jgi:Ca-activated chloride channel homolog